MAHYDMRAQANSPPAEEDSNTYLATGDVACTTSSLESIVVQCRTQRKQLRRRARLRCLQSSPAAKAVLGAKLRFTH